MVTLQHEKPDKIANNCKVLSITLKRDTGNAEIEIKPKSLANVTKVMEMTWSKFEPLKSGTQRLEGWMGFSCWRSIAKEVLYL